MQRLYETMVIVDSNKAKENYEAVEAEVLDCITRHGGEVVKAIRWDERRLAYEIKRVKRGLYILIHFNADPSILTQVDRQFRLSETVLRAMILVDEDGVETRTGSARERAEAATAAPAEASETKSDD